MTLTIDQTSDVLKIAQRADKRTIAKGDIEFWQIALRSLDYREAAAAMTEHYTHSTDYAMPAHILQIVRDHRRSERVPFAPDSENHCGRPTCQCTHTYPCDHGWLEADPPGSTSLGGALHCPRCHPGRRQEPDESRLQWMARLQKEDAAWQRKQRSTEM